MKHASLLSLCLIALTALPAFAQQLGIGGMNNHLSNGVLLTYSPKWNKNWNIDLGLRIYTKVNLIGNNDQLYAYYQQGYAKSFPEYFALNFRLTRRIFTYKFLELGFMTNLFISWEGIRNDSGPYKFKDPDTGEWLQGGHNFDYFKPSPAAELTIGPTLRIAFSHRVSIYGTLGYGMIYMHHSHKGWNETFNQPTVLYNLDDFKIFEKWKRGATEMVGLDKLPMISFGVKYRFK